MQLLTKQTEYKHQPSIVFRCDYHIIWCTKYRRPVLESPIAERLKFLIYEKQDEYGYEVLEVEIMPDHVHLVSGLSPQRAPNLIIGNIKRLGARAPQGVPSIAKPAPVPMDTREVYIVNRGRNS